MGRGLHRNHAYFGARRHVFSGRLASCRLVSLGPTRLKRTPLSGRHGLPWVWEGSELRTTRRRLPK